MSRPHPLCLRAFPVLLFLAGLFPVLLPAQEELPKEELLRMLGQRQSDSTLIDIYNELCWPVYSYDKPDSSLYFGNLALSLAEKKKDLARLAVAHRRIGITYINLNDFKKAVEHQEISYELSERTGYRRGMMLALNNIGTVYLNNEIYNQALTYFLSALKIGEEIGDYSAAPSIYANCGSISRQIGDEQSAREYFQKSLKYALQNGDNNLTLQAHNSLSASYRLSGDFDSAAAELEKARLLFDENTFPQIRFNFALTEGLLHSARGKHRQALSLFTSILPSATGATDRITLLINIGEAHLALGEHSKAFAVFTEAFEASRRHRMFNKLEFQTNLLAETASRQGDHALFTKYIRLHLAYRDSNEINNKRQQVVRQQLEYEYERRHIADSVSFAQKDLLKSLELEAAEGKLLRARTAKILLISALIIVALAGMFVFSRFVVIRNQKTIIEQQKQLVEAKNEEVLDSITYAKRLQNGILPPLAEIRRHFDTEILFLPKDIIGGDFYFYEEYHAKAFFAVCDCTGHGVPGALMSVVCYQALDKAIKSFKLSDPGQILEKAREIVVDNLNAKDQNIRDGMDCSLLVLDTVSGELEWAGAYNGLWIVQKGILRELKGSKQPVALHENPQPFQTHRLGRLRDASVYLYTDGFADQFGGNELKKFKSKRLKELAASIAGKPVAQQVEILNTAFANWKGSQAQVDDVAIAVLRL